MTNYVKKRFIMILAIAMILAAIPLQASAASAKTPAKVKVTSVKATTASVKDNCGSITVKWKKVKYATGYQIYAKSPGESWFLLAKVGKKYSSARIKNVAAGKYYVKVRAIRKSGGKTKKGKFSQSKGIFINSKITLEKYFKMNPDVWNESVSDAAIDGMELQVSGNSLIYYFNLSELGLTEENAKSQDTKDALDNALSEESNASIFNDVRKSLRDSTGIQKVIVVVQYTFNGEYITSRSYK